MKKLIIFHFAVFCVALIIYGLLSGDYLVSGAAIAFAALLVGKYLAKL